MKTASNLTNNLKKRYSCAGPAVKIRKMVMIIFSLLMITIWSLLMLVIAIVTLFRMRRLYSEYLGKWIAKIILWQWGIRIVVHQENPLPSQQFVYISNHTSTLDIFVLVALGLPNCRNFLSGWLRWYLPLGMIATIMGTFFTVPQSRPAQRIKIFKNVQHVLQTTGESVYLSPEGKRVTNGEIGHFNKGAFHLATVLQAPIVPIYIQIPKDSNPGIGFNAQPGTVHVYFNLEVSTRNWKVNDLVENKESVRRLFLELHEKYTQI